ncbi:MAG: hypothetical protein IJV35_11090 [Neisseriaceae bacterium]|nr:hypothetical protein [Neisseriaceae bacterium]
MKSRRSNLLAMENGNEKTFRQPENNKMRGQQVAYACLNGNFFIMDY